MRIPGHRGLFITGVALIAAGLLLGVTTEVLGASYAPVGANVEQQDQNQDGEMAPGGHGRHGMGPGRHGFGPGRIPPGGAVPGGGFHRPGVAPLPTPSPST